VALAHKGTNGGSPTGGAARVADQTGRWADEAHELVQVLGGWLEDAGRLHADVSALEAERNALAEEVRRLREDSEVLRGERDGLSDALQALAAQATRAADAALHRISGRQ
jgi:chromosome segregation ATPase